MYLGSRRCCWHCISHKQALTAFLGGGQEIHFSLNGEVHMAQLVVHGNEQAALGPVS